MRAYAIKTSGGYIGYGQYSKNLIGAKLYASKKDAEKTGGFVKEFADNKLVSVEIKLLVKKKKKGKAK